MSTGTLKTYNTFVKGIVTEAGPLTYPENASLDEENFVLNREGSRQRRLGMDFESDFALHPVTLASTDAVAVFRWHNVANDPARQFAVVQAADQLHIFDASETSISNNLVGTVDASSVLTGVAIIQADSLEGYLIIASGTGPVAYLSYDSSDGTFAITQISIKIRDFLGVDDGLAVDARPGALTAAHNYNLRNQGWGATQISAYQVAAGVYPANNQQWFIGKDTAGDFDPALLNKMDFGTTPAPKGRFIIDAFNRSASRETQSGVASLPTDLETTRPSTICGAFQRVWYAGMESGASDLDSTRPNMTGWVLYSRIVRAPKDFEQAYSDADPTSEADSSPVETDGGYIIIPNSGKIHRLVDWNSTVIVFAQQGVWAVVGGDRGFTATEHQVVKVTAFGVETPWSVVVTEESVLYWNKGGIYVLNPGQIAGFSATNLTENTIQTLYNEISLDAKRTAVGTYDPINRKVTWLYNDEENYNPVSYGRRYNVELVLDTVLGAFTKHRISAVTAPSPYVAGFVETPEFLLRQEGIRTRGESITKYLVVQFVDTVTNDAVISFGYYRDPTFRDWKSIDTVGTSFKAYLLTGDEIMGDAARDKRVPYLFMHMKQTERNAVLDAATGQAMADNPSGLLVQARWDWSDHPDSGKWQEPFQAYKLKRPILLQAGQPITYGHEVVTTKTRITGSGKGLRLYMESDGDKDAYIYGWVARYGGNVNV